MKVKVQPNPKKTKEQEEGIRFVRLVKKHPCLYNYQLPEYSLREAVDDAWKKIAAELRCEPAGLREKWRNYRTVFLRRCKADKNSGSRSSYYLKDEMNFLLDYVKVSVPLKRSSNISRDFASTNGSYTVVMPQDDETTENTDFEMFQVIIDYCFVVLMNSKSHSFILLPGRHV